MLSIYCQPLFKRHRWLSQLIYLSLIIIAGSVYAEEQDEDVLEEKLYIAIGPSFILNYQAPVGVHYVRTDIFVAVRGEEAQKIIQKHIPLLQDSIVHMLSSQEQDIIATPSGRLELKEMVRADLENKINKEEGVEILEVLFTNYFVE